VGSKQRLESGFHSSGIPISKQITFVEQSGTLMENVWNGFLATIDGYTLGAEREDSSLFNRIALFLPGDIPMICAEEIDEFLDGTDMSQHDWQTGLTPRQVLDPFRSTAEREGIDTSYFHTKEGLYRINNLHIARPFAFKNRLAVQQIYDARYQKSIFHFLQLTYNLWQIKTLRGRIRRYMFMWLALFLRRIKLDRLSDLVRGWVPRDEILWGVGQVLGLRAGCAITTRGGAAFDVDNAHDYGVLQARYEEWAPLLCGPRGDKQCDPVRATDRKELGDEK
jgi:hypothetical protein